MLKRISRLLTVAIPLLGSGCITNDIPYPLITINVLSISGEGFVCESKDIDTKTNIATLHLDEKTDISKVRITEAVLTEQGTSSVELVGTHDLRTPIYTTLKLYQEYPWQIVASQPIERYFQVENQIGAAEIDPEDRSVRIRVSKAADINRIKVLRMKLGPTEITDYSPSLDELSGTSFASRRQVDIAYHDFSERWTIHAEVSEQTVSLKQADAWTKQIWLYGEGLEGEAMGFRYRLSGTEEWQEVPEVTTDAGAFKACLRGLTPATEYEVIAYSGEAETQPQALTTDIEAPLPNGGFEQWSTNPKKPNLYYPYTDEATRFWDTGNTGATSIGGPSITIPVDDPRPGSAGRQSAKLQSKVVVIKFAAGNLFVGKYLTTTGTNGIVGFGQPFTQRPTALRGWVKFKGGVINRIDSDLRPAGVEIEKGKTPENGMIFVALGNWTPEQYGVELDGKWWGDAQTPIAIYTKNINSFFNPNSEAVIGYGEKVMIDEIGEWTQFTIPIDYKATNLIPTHLVLVCSASRWGDYFIGSDASVLCVDDFELLYD